MKKLLLVILILFATLSISFVGCQTVGTNLSSSSNDSQNVTSKEELSFGSSNLTTLKDSINKNSTTDENSSVTNLESGISDKNSFSESSFSQSEVSSNKTSNQVKTSADTSKVSSASSSLSSLSSANNSSSVSSNNTSSGSSNNSSEVNTYTLTWRIGDEILKTEQVDYGTIPNYTGETPTKDATAEYTYTFIGWNTNKNSDKPLSSLDAVTANKTYYAIFTQTLKSYTIRWYSANNTLLEKDENVTYGTAPTYNGNTPTKAKTAEFSYTFAGWSTSADGEVLTAIPNVTGDANYYPIFTSTTNTYKVVWYSATGTQLERDENVPYGTIPTFDKGTNPTKASTDEYTYTFIGWSTSADGEVLTSIPKVTGNAFYYPIFTTNPTIYTITWKNANGNTLKTESVPYGQVPTYGENPTYTTNGEEFAFYTWTPTIEKVTSDATYTANYIEKDIEYSDFGAVGNGSTDDFEALFKAHAYANGTGATKVVAQSGKTYYICNTVPTAKLEEWATGIKEGLHATSHNAKCLYGANVQHTNANGIATDCHGNIVTDGLKTYINKNLSIIKNQTKAATIKIATNVVWTGAYFTIDDTNITALTVSGTTATAPTDKKYSTDIFTVVADSYYVTQSFSTSQYDSAIAETMTDEDFITLSTSKSHLSSLNQQIQTEGIGTNTKKLNLNLGYPAMVVIYNEDLTTSASRKIANNVTNVEQQKIYIRYGENANSGAVKQEGIIIDANGNIDASTPIMYDYTRIVKVNIYDLRVPQVTLTGGEFTTLASRIDPIFSINSDGTINNKGNAYRGAYLRRGIKVNRSNTILEGVKHYVLNELNLKDYDNGLECVHYGAFYQVSQSANVNINNCVMTGRRNNDAVGSYDFNANTVCGIYLFGCTQSNFWVVENADGTVVPATQGTANAVLGMSYSTKNSTRVQMLWGVGGTNWCKNMEYRECTLSRFDAHQGLYNGKLIDSTVNHISIIGKGTMLVENTTVLGAFYDLQRASIINLRPDYGSTWDGNIYINNVNTTTWNNGTVFTLVYYQFANHDFGYDCYLPNLYVNNFTINNASVVKDIYVFATYSTGTENMHSDILSNGDKNLNKVIMPTTIAIDDFAKYDYTISYRVEDISPNKCMSSISIPVKLTINHKKAGGELLGTETKVVDYFEVYNISPKTYSGYVANLSYIKGCYKQDRLATIDVYYSEMSSAWDGTSESANLSGSGTQTSPYLIKTGEDLKYIETQVEQGNTFVGKYFKFNNSINLNDNSITIGYYNAWNDYIGFGGIVDGNNCVIKALKINNTQTTNSNENGSSLFGAITGSVSNLTIYGEVTSKANYAGSIFGCVISGATADNCVSYVTIKGNNNNGGIAGCVDGSIINCKNYGSVTGANWNVGGIAGLIPGSASGCVNFGEVSAEIVGGIVGTAQKEIINCINYGKVTGTGTASGIACNAKGTMTNCVNYGEISAPNVSGVLANDSSEVTLTDCKNFGTINATTNASGI